MPTTRRSFALLPLGALGFRLAPTAPVLAGAWAAAPRAARAQAEPQEGRDYVRLATPVATSVGPGRFELIDFFWYGCPHCNAFEPMLQAWIARLPADVVVHRVPVAFRPEPFVAHQRIYYALDSLGLVQQMHRKVFHAIHDEHLRLDQDVDIAAFMAREGVDAARFMDAYRSFSTQTKLRQADRLVEGYQIDGVPAIGVNGRYWTSGALVGSNEQSLLVADWLVQRLRRAPSGPAARP